MQHWIERIASDLKKKNVKKHVIASGTSISGAIHIGNSCDVFIAHAITKNLKKEGIDAELVWVADDYDPLRKVPYPLPKEYKKYLGVPYSEIPCPDGCCESFAEHFKKPFLDAMKKFNIDMKIFSGAEMYKTGIYEDYIRESLNKASEIRKIFNKYRETPLSEDWLPYNPICDKCGRIGTTESYKFKDDIVYYRCKCGYEGESDIKEGRGKLTWRVEWAARWKILNVTCEPFGKDHAASGGSYDVSSEISKEIFDYPPPYPVPYEWISFKGRAMSKSKGIFFTPKQWLEIAPPETLNYFIFRSKPMKHRDFDPGFPFLNLMEQFERVERIYYGEEEAASEQEEEKLKKIYEVSVDKIEDEIPFRPPYKFMVVACQIASDMEKLYNILKRNSQLPKRLENKEFNELNEKDKKYLEERVRHVRNWLDKYAPESVKFEVQKELPKVKLSEKQIKFLNELAKVIESEELNAVELHNRIYDIMREHGLNAKEAFQAIYKVLIGKKRGPRAASFILSLDKNFVVKRFRLEA